MPRYAYQKPRAKVYAYNFGYMNNYYKPMTHYLEKEPSMPRERPGAQSLAERLKKFPMNGSIYQEVGPHYRSHSLPREPETTFRSSSLPRELETQIIAAMPDVPIQREGSVTGAVEPARTVFVPAKGHEIKVVPLYLKHPFRLPVEDEVMPVHESSIWPEGRKHFDLVSSYDVMCGYLGLYPRKI